MASKTQLTPAAQVDAIRLEITRVVEEIEWTETSRVPVDEAKQRARDAARVLCASDDLAHRRFNLITESNGTGAAAVDAALSCALPLHVGTSVPADVKIAFALAWLLGEQQLAQLLEARVDDLDYVAGPPTAARPEKLKALRAELFRLECEEERRIMAALAADTFIGRRPDADPKAVLEFDEAGDMPEIYRMPGRVYARPGGEAPNIFNPSAGASGATAAPAAASAGMPAPSMASLHQNAVGAAVNRARGQR